ncbi:DEAD/DEAH box helicase [bacterium]|nr:DEAD/DEAH box helicase [bacterium]
MNFEIKTDLMAHQQDAVEKLSGVKVAALFMDMGTGKTLTALEWLRRKADKINKVVYFCPVSVKKTIATQIELHTNASCYVFSDKTKQDKIPVADFYIVGIESMQSSKRTIFAAMSLINDKTAVICDESTYIKNYNASRARWITECGKKAKYRMILTGTPMSNGFKDIFAQMYFLSPLILGYNSFYSFAANHLEYSDKYPGMVKRAFDTDLLAKKMQPYVYQVKKDDCLDLPEKSYSTRYYRLTALQSQVYQLRKEEFFEEISNCEEIRPTMIFNLFTDLQKICSGYWQDGDKTVFEEHKRIDVLKETIEDMPKDAKIVIWAKYMHDIDGILSMLHKEYGADCASEYTGRKSEKERAIEAKRFTEDRRFFVGTQATGGHGLNELVCSNYAVFYNNNFKFGERLQAEDRQHRLGQKNAVHYVDIAAYDTIDERINKSLAKKESIMVSFQREIEEIKRLKSGADKKLKEVLKKL